MATEVAPADDQLTVPTIQRHSSCPASCTAPNIEQDDSSSEDLASVPNLVEVEEPQPPFELTVFPLTRRPRTPSNHWLGFFGGHCFAVEGIIGAGKTTLLRGISKYFALHGMPCVVYSEEVPMPLLTKFLQEEAELAVRRHQHARVNAFSEDGAKLHYNCYAFQLQMEMLQRRISIYQRGCAIAEGERKAVFFDRSIWGDVVFAAMHRDAGRMNRAEADQYAAKLAKFRSDGDCVDLSMLLYLQCDPEQALQRVISRTKGNGGGAESGYDLPYMQALTGMYDKVLEAHTTVSTRRRAADCMGTPVIHVDGKARDVSSEADVATWVEGVLREVAMSMFLAGEQVWD